jgi:hypothetical protein
MSQKVINLYRWEVVTFPWGTAVKEQRTDKWIALFLSPTGQMVNVEKISVQLHENGIEFL